MTLLMISEVKKNVENSGNEGTSVWFVYLWVLTHDKGRAHTYTRQTGSDIFAATFIGISAVINCGPKFQMSYQAYCLININP